MKAGDFVKISECGKYGLLAIWYQISDIIPWGENDTEGKRFF